MRFFERCLRYTPICSIARFMYLFSLSLDSMSNMFCSTFAISNVVEYLRNDLSREFCLSLEFTRNFTSRDFSFYIKLMRSKLLRLDVILR